mmetsp:Transcript_35786/g.93875  ORF Transcript_35786/g.93875 Transcript_35786/m.93875 type:complete len:623 (-) Transcript_35786:524-2392(-)|eukprot:CAMPEP_0113684238 /NCGR_PEP_ID=MMETSP0038_2-20120614/13869_1 /TAXON_ID=2898 /ORGANISM="Cryptomonas paramecium" /LENGTH=622 /DNA_ID=CAMNT_0000603919 /DNA_START=238 /DNA_END=2106 /DNA_ORIENTATION=- /assembly_acc=CAM_ASM_000170
MSASSAFTSQGSQRKQAARPASRDSHAFPQDSARDARSLQGPLRMGTSTAQSPPLQTSSMALSKSAPTASRSLSSPKVVKDQRPIFSDPLSARNSGTVDSRMRATKNRSLAQGREISSVGSSSRIQADSASYFGPRSPTVVVNPSVEFSFGPTRLVSSGRVSPFLVASTVDDSAIGSDGAANRHKMFLSARGPVPSNAAKRDWSTATSAIPLERTSLSQGSLQVKANPPLPAGNSSYRSFSSSSVQASNAQDMLLKSSSAPVRVVDAATQTQTPSPEPETLHRLGEKGLIASFADASIADSKGLISPGESGDEWGDYRTNSSVASVSSRVASSTAASQCATLPFDPADCDPYSPGLTVPQNAEYLEGYRKSGYPKHQQSQWPPVESIDAGVDDCGDYVRSMHGSDDGMWARRRGLKEYSPDITQELQRVVDLQAQRHLPRCAHAEEGPPAALPHPRIQRVSPGAWSPATMEIRRLATDGYGRSDSPAAMSAPISHYHRPPNPGGASVGSRFGGGMLSAEQVRADSDSLSSSGTPASLKLTPRICRSPPLHVTRVPCASRDSVGSGGSCGTSSPRVAPSETLTPRPGPGSSGDSPLSTPRDRSAFLAPLKTQVRSLDSSRIGI